MPTFSSEYRYITTDADRMNKMSDFRGMRDNFVWIETMPFDTKTVFILFSLGTPSYTAYSNNHLFVCQKFQFINYKKMKEQVGKTRDFLFIETGSNGHDSLVLGKQCF